jgi:hypothetical protein
MQNSLPDHSVRADQHDFLHGIFLYSAARAAPAYKIPELANQYILTRIKSRANAAPESLQQS